MKEGARRWLTVDVLLREREYLKLVKPFSQTIQLVQVIEHAQAYPRNERERDGV